jgi:hypothetical protein
MEWPKLFKLEDIKPEDINNTREHTVKPNIEPPFKNVESLLQELSKDFDRISVKLRLLIGTKSFDKEITDLLIDSRGDRKGFPAGVVATLLSLLLRHEEEYGYLYLKKK